MMKFMMIINMMNLNYPLILNIMILMLISIPMKFNNFHPLKLIIMLIFLTFLISFKMNLITKSWMNFFILLIMIGGLMVIFMYITSLNNNTLLKFNLNNIIKNFFKLMIMLLIIIYLFNFNFFNNQDLLNLNLNLYEEKNDISMMNLFNLNKISMMFIMLYLYFSLICIMNICYKMKNPLRQINYYE